ncbi:MBL fold metallo-hydrolase [Oscillatoria sp. FACHB-1406]|uniref:MBL fold metallo-hydrolase n=1 Tax=Oscillatoria sp. FACHB-1406 TaxID=2692846 RepID=UPI001686E4CF|nr:MBL fold metallo-hydrolase [Oscillatoria sp. FACHB-1406]MBD2577718.1 MBL fold metallo-hydrolase [Oscillatoria sp. FACHB-1406]
MATVAKRRSQNSEGDFYVDSTCIDCDTCRWMSPETFHRTEEQSAVYHQPTTPEERLTALQALLSCPTASIGTTEKAKDIKAVQETFPIPIEDNVYHCGYHSELSYAAASYFIQHPDGNILVDSPRFASPLVKRLEALGGVRWLYLTHRDDVADWRKFREHFGCTAILHADDVSEKTRDVEMQLTGEEPVTLAADITIIPVPGHTKGHTVLLYRDKFLFTGDHLARGSSGQHLTAFRAYCWYSWPQQIESMRKLQNYTFEWILPGHGRRYHSDRATMQQELAQCITWMEAH